MPETAAFLGVQKSFSNRVWRARPATDALVQAHQRRSGCPSRWPAPWPPGA
jgi:hypothetical protein